MKEQFHKIEETVDHVKEYINTKVEQVKLGAAEKASDIVSVFIARTLVGILVLFVVLFASEGIAVGLGSYFHKPWLGYLLVAFFYLVCALIVWAAREQMLRIPIMNAIIERLFKNDEQHEKN